MADNNEPGRLRVIKNIGTRIKHFPPKRAEGLQNRANPVPTNNQNHNRKDKEEA